jgi:hypothetical protein
MARNATSPRCVICIFLIVVPPDRGPKCPVSSPGSVWIAQLNEFPFKDSRLRITIGSEDLGDHRSDEFEKKVRPLSHLTRRFRIDMKGASYFERQTEGDAYDA